MTAPTSCSGVVGFQYDAGRTGRKNLVKPAMKDERYASFLQPRADHSAFVIPKAEVEHRHRQIWVIGQRQVGAQRVRGENGCAHGLQTVADSNAQRMRRSRT